MDIRTTLAERFAAPLPDGHARRIIFWQDPDAEFAQLAEELELDNVKILRLTGKNAFKSKLLLSETDTRSNYLVYNPVASDDIRDNWLLDIELYSEEFRADLISLRMQEFGIPDTAQFRNILRDYKKFFGSKERVSLLKALGTEYAAPGQLHIDILAVLAGTRNNTPGGVIRALLEAGTDDERNEALQRVRRFGKEEVLWGMTGRYTGYIAREDGTLSGLAAHLLITALSVTLAEKNLQGLEEWISPEHRQACYTLINEWLHSDGETSLYDIARAVEERFRLAERFDRLEPQALLTSECFPCINECILRRLLRGLAEAAENTVCADDIINTVEKRRTLKWYSRVRYVFDGLEQAARMQIFYREHAGGFHAAEAERMWKDYCADLCRMDYHYRMFNTAFMKCLRESSTGLEDQYKSAAEYVENLYKNWFLTALGEQWSRLTADMLRAGARPDGLPQQTDFYTSFVSPQAASMRTFVIVSDALRYEVAVDLTGQLQRDTAGAAKISAVQGILPSVTPYGMAALLPHRKLQWTATGKVTCDGLPTDGTDSRAAVIASAYPGSTAVTYKALLGMKQAERRELVSNAKVVYIYHNAIDAVGDKPSTEDQVFEACSDAITEIKNLVRIIVNDLNGTYILITADHGFIYTAKPLAESDMLRAGIPDERMLETERRYIITDSDSPAPDMLETDLRHLGIPARLLMPRAYIRIKRPGAGANYVHGGASLQECVVPVIEFRNIRATSKRYVDVRKPELELISQSRKISNSIFSLDFYQKEPVGGKVAAAAYEAYITDETGREVSDRRLIIADRTSANGEDRVFRPRFTLKNADFRKDAVYRLVIRDRDTGKETSAADFSIDIAFVNEFDF